MNDQEVIENLDMLLNLDILSESKDLPLIEELQDIENLSSDSKQESK